MKIFKDSDKKEHPNGVWIHHLKAHDIYTAKIDSDYLDKLVAAKVKRVYLKVFDGKYNRQLNPTFWHWQCSPEIIQSFKSKGIQVYGWGYHYGSADIDEQITKVKEALECGLDGYVVDAEAEVEQTNTHTNVDKLLFALRPLLQEGTLGYTSFGNPRKHPNVPWQILDKYCDLAFPQIYFEKWKSKSTPEEVQDCLDAHKRLGLTKPILPIWGSEDDTVTKYRYTPASASELQDYLNNYPGSSLWRIPHQGELGEAWNLIYSGFELPILTEILRFHSQGKDVKALQKALNARGFNAGTVDGDFGKKTKAAVEAFQAEAGLEVDGEVGLQTWSALGGKFDDTSPSHHPIGDYLKAELVKFGDLSPGDKEKVEAGFIFPSNLGNRYAKPSNSIPKRWEGEPGQRARYISDPDMPVVADPTKRSPQQIIQVIEYFNVEDSDNNRYWPQPDETYCNIWATDVMRCLRAPLTHWVITNEKGKEKRKELDANATFDWLSNPSNGWRKVSASEAVNSSKNGIPTLLCWKKPGGIGHIAVVLPKGSTDNVRIAQAGRKNSKDMPLKSSSNFAKNAKFFVYVG